MQVVVVEDSRRCVDRCADDSGRAWETEAVINVRYRGAHAILLDGVAAAAYSRQGVTVEVFAHFQVFDHLGQSILSSVKSFKTSGALGGRPMNA